MTYVTRLKDVPARADRAHYAGAFVSVEDGPELSKRTRSQPDVIIHEDE
jgi:hypothetical protein